ncbi:MAG: carbohydrate kinase family protein [bacterium]|nr:carbohydrate kinase family protein [bacterium]
MAKSNFDVITIGTAVRDVFLSSPLFKIVEDKEHLKKLGFEDGKAECFAFGGKIKIDKPIFTSGGGATNAAVTFARAGLKTAAILSLGKDSIAKEIIDELKEEKINPIVSYSSENGTGYDTILLNLGGERSILVYRGASNDLSLRSIGLSKLKSKWVYISPGQLPLELVKEIVNHFHKSGSFIAMNPSSHYLKLGQKRLESILQKVSVLTLNRSEAALLVNGKGGDDRQMLKKIAKLSEAIVVITDGANGSCLSDGKLIYRAGIFPEKVLRDRTGAGDAFGSAVVAVIAKSKEHPDKISENTIKQALRFASANATSVVEHIGSKAGILKEKDFEGERRFKNFSVRKTLL